MFGKQGYGEVKYVFCTSLYFFQCISLETTHVSRMYIKVNLKTQVIIQLNIIQSNAACLDPNLTDVCDILQWHIWLQPVQPSLPKWGWGRCIGYLISILKAKSYIHNFLPGTYVNLIKSEILNIGTSNTFNGKAHVSAPH